MAELVPLVWPDSDYLLGNFLNHQKYSLNLLSVLFIVSDHRVKVSVSYVTKVEACTK